MSKKMKIPSIFFKNKSEAPVKQAWQYWPSCKHPKTLSFRATSDNDEVFKTVNSIFIDTSDVLETPESWFTNSSSNCSTFSTDDYSDNNISASESLDMIIRGVRLSERLFFEPGDTTSSIVKPEEINNDNMAMMKISSVEFKESVALALESDDPYSDFKKSMAEMVESHGLKDWGCLEELLGWYLRMNAKSNHAFIVGAFVDLLVDINSSSSSSSSSNCSSMAVCCSDSTSYSSADSCFSSPSNSLFSPTEGGDQIGIQEHTNVISQS